MTAAPELDDEPVVDDDEVADALALLRQTSTAMREAMEQTVELAAERQRILLFLRSRRVPFTRIAEGSELSENTVYKIHREAKQAQAEGKL